MKTLEEMREDSNWPEAFKYAKFTMDEVDRVIASDDGENDERPWVAVFGMKDDSFTYLEAGCDYTGWDCQAGGESFSALTLADLRRWQMTKVARQRLNLTLPDLDGDEIKEGRLK